VYVVGLTGGIGAGKSTVAGLLRGRGAVVVDSDVLAREVVEPGMPGFSAVVEAFGLQVVAADGRLDRKALAARVFRDSDARFRLNAIVHPLVRARTDELLSALPVDAVAVHDIPLLVEAGAADRYDLVVTVEAPVEVRVRRLAARGLDPEDARARIAAQASEQERRAVADVVLENAGAAEELWPAVDALWERIAARP
jgi:dephospho-CoA kinase